MQVLHNWKSYLVSAQNREKTLFPCISLIYNYTLHAKECKKLQFLYVRINCSTYLFVQVFNLPEHFFFLTEVNKMQSWKEIFKRQVLKGLFTP